MIKVKIKLIDCYFYYAPEIFYIDFYVFCLILLENRDLLDFYCRASIVHNIMLSALIFTWSFSSPLSEVNAMGVRIQPDTE